MIPSDAPDELESTRLRKAMHFLAELGEALAMCVTGHLPHRDGHLATPDLLA